MDKNEQFKLTTKKSPKKSYFFSEAQIRYAMKHTKSNTQAADFLNINILTYRKYAKMYIDEKTGKDLYELHKNYFGRGIKKTFSESALQKYKKKRIISTEDILDGKHPHLSTSFVKNRLIKDGYLIEKCYECGFNEKRVLDGKVPLVLSFKDGNRKNYRLENLSFLCYNCYFLYVGNIMGNKRTIKLMEEKLRKHENKIRKNRE